MMVLVVQYKCFQHATTGIDRRYSYKSSIVSVCVCVCVCTRRNIIIRVWGNIFPFREYLEAILGFGKDFFQSLH